MQNRTQNLGFKVLKREIGFIREGLGVLKREIRFLEGLGVWN